MLALARANPFFILPLPRDADPESTDTTVKTDEYDMYCLQWIFHAAPPAVPVSANPDKGGNAAQGQSTTATATLPRSSSAILTPLEEYKKNGEWAQPYLTFTHYPDLGHSHDLVLMRGEISAASAGGPGGGGSLANPGWLLSKQQAQLLALAMQQFYCADIIPPSETPQMAKARQDRKDMLRGLREKPEEWDWTKLVHMAYGGIV
jgi:ATP synthase F1 complex assembly factor 1